MKKLIPFVIFLASCARETPVSETITENAVNSVTAIEKNLAPECKTDGIKTQLITVKSEIRTILQACQTEKDIITRDKIKWKIGFWSLIGIIAAYIAKKLTR